jgi:hypothetical protein
MAPALTIDINVASDLLSLSRRTRQASRSVLLEKQVQAETSEELKRAINNGATLRSGQYVPGQPSSAPFSSRAQTVQASTLRVPFVPARKVQEVTSPAGLNDTVFLVISNSNAARDDNFKIYIEPLQGGTRTALRGIADFTPDDEPTAYLWSWMSSTLTVQIERYFSSDPYNYIFASTYIQPGRLKRRPRADTGAIFMENIKQNNNGNFGTGHIGVGSPRQAGFTFYTFSWLPRDGENELLTFPWSLEGQDA